MKQKFLIFFFLIFSFSFTAFSQSDTTSTDKTNWSQGGIIGINFSNVGLKNWAGGGSDMISLSWLTSFIKNYKLENLFWDNSLDLGYGVVKQGNEGVRKSDDKIILTSKFGYNASESLYYTALLDFRTQFDAGYDYNKTDTNKKYLFISNFMSPAYLSLGLGINYKPDVFWQFFISPVSNRITFVLDDELSKQGAYGVESGEKILSQLGATANILFQRDIFENVNLKSRLNLFAPYKSITTLVVNSETVVNMKVNDYINASFGLDLIYDEKVNINRDDGTKGPDTQIRHVIAIGFAYKFGDYK